MSATATLTPPQIGQFSVALRGTSLRIQLAAIFEGAASASDFSARIQERLAEIHHAAEQAYRQSTAHADLHNLEAAHKELTISVNRREEAAGDLAERIRKATVAGAANLSELVGERDRLAADKVRLGEAGKLLAPARKAAEAEWERLLDTAVQDLRTEAEAEYRALRDMAMEQLGVLLDPLAIQDRLRCTDKGQLKGHCGAALPE